MKRISLASVLVAAVVLVALAAFGAQQADQTPSEKEFCRLDKDNDRLITFDEFASCEFYKLEHVRKLPVSDPAFKNGRGGQMTDNELKVYLFNKADKNKDRKIDRKEWEEFYNEIMNIKR